MTKPLSLKFMLIVGTLLTVASSAHAQGQNTVLFGFGRSNVYDTYLSPIEYTGPEMTISVDTERRLKRNPHICFHTFNDIRIGYTENPAQTANEVDGGLSHDFGWSYRWGEDPDCRLPRNLSLGAGLTAGAAVAGTYNDQNGNNPAQGRASLRLCAMFLGNYTLHVRRQQLVFNYTARMPLFGAMFSPDYGQSYYNLFAQGNWDGNILATHPGNALTLYQRFTVSLKMKKRMLTVGYESQLEQAKPKNLRQHHYHRGVVIGWTLERKKSRK